MGQTKQARGLASLSRATDTLSTLLAQQVRELNARQKAAKKPRSKNPPKAICAVGMRGVFCKTGNPQRLPVAESSRIAPQTKATSVAPSH